MAPCKLLPAVYSKEKPLRAIARAQDRLQAVESALQIATGVAAEAEIQSSEMGIGSTTMSIQFRDLEHSFFPAVLSPECCKG